MKLGKMDAIEAIYKRRSIREYLDRKVDKEKIDTLLKAAMAAPTAMNSKPWEFIISDESEKLSKLKEEFTFARYNSPIVIIVCGNMEKALTGLRHEFWVQDCSAAIQNILIAATALGLGSVWMGVYPFENRIKFIQRLFDIPESVIPLGMVYVGYSAEEKNSRTQYDEKRVHWYKY